VTSTSIPQIGTLDVGGMEKGVVIPLTHGMEISIITPPKTLEEKGIGSPILDYPRIPDIM
jgi:hypothetical protein